MSTEDTQSKEKEMKVRREEKERETGADILCGYDGLAFEMFYLGFFFAPGLDFNVRSAFHGIQSLPLEISNPIIILSSHLKSRVHSALLTRE